MQLLLSKLMLMLKHSKSFPTYYTLFLCSGTASVHSWPHPFVLETNFLFPFMSLLFRFILLHVIKTRSESDFQHQLICFIVAVILRRTKI